MSVGHDRPSDAADSPASGPHTATVNEGVDGETIGATLFLGAAELEALGIEDADEVSYEVRDGQL